MPQLEPPSRSQLISIPLELPPQLIVFIDAEEEFEWTSFSRTATSVVNISRQGPALEVLNRYGITPTFLVDYPVATKPESTAPLLEFLSHGLIRIGSQLHPWVNPPHDETLSVRNTYPGNLPRELESAKIQALTEAIRDTFQIQPRTYRSGRYGFGPNTADLLRLHGYETDSSFMPLTNYTATGGPDFSAIESQPFWLNDERSVLELPITVGLIGRLSGLGPSFSRSVSGRIGRGIHLGGLLARTQLLEKIRLTPEGIPLELAKEMTRTLITRGQRVFNLTYHSSSLLPGATPYVKTRDDLKRFIDWLEQYCDFFFNEVRGQTATPEDVYARAKFTPQVPDKRDLTIAVTNTTTLPHPGDSVGVVHDVDSLYPEPASKEKSLEQPADTQTAAPSPQKMGNLVSGSTWMVAMRFGVRLIGVASTVVLARLLTPADFGLVAMAMLVISFLEVFSDTGQQLALIRHPNPQRSHYDSAWTSSLILNSALTLIILAASPFAGSYFNEERVEPVIQLLAFRVFLIGLVNIGTIDFRRHLNFRREFQYFVLRKMFSFVATLACAFWLRSYWALAIGTVVGHVLEVVLSYVMHPYRPRFDLSKVREIWSYSIWLLVAALGRFFEGRIDAVVAAGIVDSSRMGLYTISVELGALPVTEILDPAARALFPNYVRVANNPELLANAYLGVFAATVSVAAVLGTGVASVANEFVTVLLGGQWLEAVPLVQIFAFSAAVSGVCGSVYPVLNAAGESRITAIQTWIRVCLFIPALAWAASTGELINFALAQLSVTILLIPMFFWRLMKILPLTWSALLARVWRAPLAACAMAFGISWLRAQISLPHPSLGLLIFSLFGAFLFVSTHAFLWLLAGRPAGLEAEIVELARQLLKRRFARAR